MISKITSKKYCHLEVVVWRCSAEKIFLKISQNSQENTYAGVSLLIKLQTCCPHIETSQLVCTANQLTGFYMRETGLQLYYKEIPTQVLFCEFCKVFKKHLFCKTSSNGCFWSLNLCF